MTQTEAERLTGAWTFDGMGPEFDEHVAAHLPGYADVQRLVGLVASFVIPPAGGVFADLGASTGRTAAEVLRATGDRAPEVHIYDADRSMLREAVQRVPEVWPHLRTLPAALDHEGADLTVALWLLQFISPARRVDVLRAARDAAAPTGAILIGTKTVFTDTRWQEIALASLDDYKAEHGVDPQTRAAKTVSLRGVMQAPTVNEATRDLEAAGWQSPAILWRWHGWTLIGAWASARNGEPVDFTKDH